MNYRLVQKRNPQDPEGPRKYYANAVNVGKMTIKSLAKEIAGRSSLTRGDVENVLNNFVDLLPLFLKMGLSIQLDDFGTLRLSLSSKGVEKPKDFNADMITHIRVIFTPGPMLQKELDDIELVEFRLLKEKDNEGGEGSEDAETAEGE